ncbi:MAG: hypothetical protein M2R45_01837 [Verrucomicrobia subdivision 3 bacterium]|nr:hypothetical protein [Limisphaerales bacterium]MCS1415637.1 hypothetical protein [Limisphaerales bacterium]
MTIVSPVVHREFLVRSRAQATYRMRLWMAVISLALILFVAWTTFGLRPTAAGVSSLFQFYAWALWIFCLFEGVRQASDCLSEEKREGTIGLLFLTHLQGFDVVLGKVSACFIASFFPVLSVMPLLSILFIYGGVTGDEFARIFGAVLTTLLLSLSLALWVSARSISAGRSFATTGVILVLWNLVGGVALRVNVSIPSPFDLFCRSFDRVYRGFPSGYWISLSVMLGLAALFVFLASRTIRRKWNEEQPMSVNPGTKKRFSTRQRYRSRILLEQYPIAWLLGRSNYRMFLLFFAVPVLALSIPVVWVTGSSMDSLLNCGIWLIVIWHAIRFFCNSKRAERFELLLTTGVTIPGFILQLNYVAKRVAFFGMVLLLLGEIAHLGIRLLQAYLEEGFYGLMNVRISPFGASGVFLITDSVWRHLASHICQLLTGAIAGGVMLYGAYWYGLWRGAISKTVAAAFGRSVFVAGVVYSIGISILLSIGEIYRAIQFALGGGYSLLVANLTALAETTLVGLLFYHLADRSKRGLRKLLARQSLDAK